MVSPLTRLFRHVRRRVSWGLPVQVFAFVFVTGWLLMAWAEPPGSRIVDSDAYWWWFATTVTPAASGQSEFHPTTAEGQLVGVYVIVGGIATITALFTKLATAMSKARRLHMQGRGELRLSGHIAILGYTPGRTESLVDRLVADEPREMVLCAWEGELQEHPMADRDDVQFVRGNLTDADVLHRAAIPTAAAALVDARDDNEAIKVTVAVSHTNPDLHTVVALRDMEYALTVSRVAERACCIDWHSLDIITEELHDPGMSLVYRELMRDSDRNTYSVSVPDTLPGRTFGEFQLALGRWHAATILAMRRDSDLLVSPSWYEETPPGTVLYYVGKRRIHAPDLERFVDRAEQVVVSTDDGTPRSGPG